MMAGGYLLWTVDLGCFLVVPDSCHSESTFPSLSGEKLCFILSHM